MRDVLWVSDSTGPRFELALDLLKDGKSIIFRGVLICVNANSIDCEVFSSRQCESLTHDLAMADLDHARQVFSYLNSNSPEFASIVNGRSVNFALIEDCGMGMVAVLCRLAGDQIDWSP